MLTTVQTAHAKGWKDVYVAALMESNDDRILSLISEAEQAIKLRARELFNTSGDHIQEEQAMDDAMYALHALRSCLAVHGRYADAS